MPDSRRRLERVRAAGGAAASAALSVLDLVFAAGGSSCRGGLPTRAARRRRRRSFFLNLAVISAMWLVCGGGSLRAVGSIGTLGDGWRGIAVACSRSADMERVMRRLSPLSSSTLGTGCTLGSV